MAFGILASPMEFRPVKLDLPRWTNIFVGLCLACVVMWNHADAFSLRFPGQEFVRRFSLLLRLDQAWNMFSPYPIKDDGWFVIPAKLRDGTEFDLFTGKPVRWEKPALVSALYKNDRWRKYMMNISARAHEDYRLYLAQYYCREWNQSHEGAKQLSTFEIDYMLEDTLPNYQTAEPKKLILWKHDCFGIPK
jgi:hypothetical protein